MLRLKRLISNALTQLQLDYGGVSWFIPIKKIEKTVKYIRIYLNLPARSHVGAIYLRKIKLGPSFWKSRIMNSKTVFILERNCTIIYQRIVSAFTQSLFIQMALILELLLIPEHKYTTTKNKYRATSFIFSWTKISNK